MKQKEYIHNIYVAREVFIRDKRDFINKANI